MKLKISGKIILSISFITLILIVIMGYFIYRSVMTELEKVSLHDLRTQLTTIESFMEMGRKQTQQRVNMSLKYAHQLFYEKPLTETNETILMNATNQITLETHEVRVKKWYWNNNTLQGNYDLVDRVQNDIGGTVTLFQKIDKGFLRISTNVRKKDKSRAIGTFIPSSSNVIQTILKGETYYGRAFVVTDWYLTAYEPIKINGKIEGILYVGIPEKEIDDLKNALENLKLLGDGKITCIDSSGRFVINPLFTDTAQSIKKHFMENFYGKNAGQFDFIHPGSDRNFSHQFLHYPPFEWYLIAAFDKRDLIASSLINLQWIMVISLVIMLGCISLFVSLTLKRILSPLRHVNEMMNELSEGAGDLTRRIDVRTGDEIGELSGHFNRFMEKLTTIIAAIRDNSMILASSTSELNASMNVVASKSAELVNSSHHTATAVEEMSVTIRHISENTQQAYQDIEEGANEAIEGKKFVDRMDEAIRLVDTLSKESGRSANELSVKMNRIGDILVVINDITNRTNLLALNATIQAARAGEAGKGFEIIADEIKKLSEKTKDQTGIIEDLIKKIRQETQIVVQRMDEMNQEVEKGVSISEETGDKFERIVSKVSTIKSAMSMTVSATKQQDATTSDIARQADSVRSAVQESSTGLEQSKIAVQETTDIALRLKTLIEGFRLE